MEAQGRPWQLAKAAKTTAKGPLTLLLANFDSDTRAPDAIPHAVADPGGHLAPLEPLVDEPQPHDKFIAPQSADAARVYQIPDLLQRELRKPAA